MGGEYILKVLLWVMVCCILMFISQYTHAATLECSNYPLITYAERKTIKMIVTKDTKPSTIWKSLSTKERVEICRSIAKAIKARTT